MLEHARQFFDRVLPSLAAGQTAYYNIHWSSPAKEKDGTPIIRNGKPHKWWDGRACVGVDEACNTVAWALKQGDKDVYVCMSSQARFEEKTSQRGFAYKKALRASDDVVALKSLFLDIDVKEGAYPTTRDALVALKGFVTSTSMPAPSAVVASGSGGFHVHWALDKSLDRDTWQVLANALANAAIAQGILCDTQCTVDSARILRVPGTVNLKTGQPQPVKLLSIGAEVSTDEVRAALGKYIEALPVRSATKIAANDELGANLTTAKIEIRLEDVAKQCGFVAHSIGSGGKDNPNPLWFMTASIATFVEDGRDALHLMSNQHQGYSPVATDELYQRVETKQKEKDLGWPKCEKIAGYGCKQCQTCPLLAHKKSPLNFVLKASNDQPDLTLPEKYVRDAQGIISIRAIDESGVPITFPICHYPIMDGWLSNNPWTFHFTTRTQTGRKTTVELPTEVITAKDGFAKLLGAKGFFCTEKQYKVLKEFFVSWLQKLQTQKDKVISAAPFGWSIVDGVTEGFAYAGRLWMVGDDRPAANPNPVLSYQYMPKGDVKVWKDVAKIIYDQNRPALNAILAVAFAGPLVRFTGFPGLILNAYSSESGIGKTTAMRCSQAVWGHPVLAMQALNDTANSVLGKMGQIRSLPVYWDEIKSEAQTKRFCSIVFELTGGREKSRMNADTTLKLSGTWQTIMVSASNDSLVDGMAREAGSTTAGLHRLFEYVVPPAQTMSHDVGTVQRLVGKLEDNYGHIGLAYSKWLGNNWKRVEAEVARLQDELYTEVQVKQEERMWVATMAVVLKGAEYANELNFTRFDIPALKDFLMDVLVSMRKEVRASPSDLNSDMSISSVMAEFLNSTRNRNTLITNRVWTSKGKPSKGAIQIQNDTSKLGDLIVQIGRDDKLLRISSTSFTRWMGERGYSRATFIKKMESEFGLKTVNGKLGGGTEMVSAMEYLLEFDMNHPKLSGFIE